MAFRSFQFGIYIQEREKRTIDDVFITYNPLLHFFDYFSVQTATLYFDTLAHPIL